ncbi:hypothetical protein HS088_TW07G00662 [Tripterygium wilfordii]|uniref:Uncharacterized protein n=1 Tax=Tripterygium wilfordii TaxID=458696 RepID=A0A7J7DFJ4_TRIWF|nr:uncharacterized protein LOC120001250 [Tripterygium wilfordii]KAF5745081.1 hypothetical protein HS088_TW07G00662 [Tripterygium wilfordii]
MYIEEETMGSQDFSFPKVINSTPQLFTFSPSLWRASSSVFPSFDDNFFDNREREADLGRNPSFSCPETSEEEEEEEDKMDVLWEDFNDKELQRVCSRERNKSRGAKTEENVNGREDDNKVVKICCVKMHKRGTAIQPHHQHKRKNMGVAVKVLIRKIFSTDKKSSRRFNNKYCLWASKSRI